MDMGKSWNIGYPLYSVYTDGIIEDIDFVKVCRHSKTLTLDEKWFAPHYNLAYTDITETVFKEIKMAHPRDKTKRGFKYLFNNNLGVRRRPLNRVKSYTRKLNITIKNYLRDTWDSNSKHIVFHSAGYDSRIISSCLMELKREEGDEWIGDIHFRCHNPEGPSFIEIMQRQGWNKTQYSVFNGPEYDHYDIANDNLVMNGFTPIIDAWNFWRDIIPPEREKEYILITGMGAQTTRILRDGAEYMTSYLTLPCRMSICENPRMEAFLHQYRERGVIASQWRMKFKDVLLPFTSYEYLDIILKAPLNYLKPYNNDDVLDNIRANQLMQFNPSVVDIKYMTHNYNFEYSREIMDKMHQKWYGSKFYNKYKSHPNIKDVEICRREMHPWSLYGFMTAYEKIYEGL